jgi:hypothetical protein
LDLGGCIIGYYWLLVIGCCYWLLNHKLLAVAWLLLAVGCLACILHISAYSLFLHLASPPVQVQVQEVCRCRWQVAVAVGGGVRGGRAGRGAVQHGSIQRRFGGGGCPLLANY